MTPYFAEPSRCSTLESAAAAWLGTPYVQSGAVRGSGASCHMLAAAVLTDAGYPIAPPPRGTTKLREYTATMRAWLDGQPERLAPVALDALQPGDILLCEIGIGHIALYLGGPERRALQVLRQSPAHYVSLGDPQAREHVLGAWRPLDSAIPQ